MTDNHVYQIENPLIIMFCEAAPWVEDAYDRSSIVCRLYPRPRDTYEGYGIMVCDLMRHIAKAFDVDEDDVWEWVDKERHHPTIDLQLPS